MRKFSNYIKESIDDITDIENIFLELEEDTDIDLDIHKKDNKVIITLTISGSEYFEGYEDINDIESLIKQEEKKLYVSRKLKVACLRLEYYSYEYTLKTDGYEYTISLYPSKLEYDLIDGFYPENFYMTNREVFNKKILSKVFKDKYNLTIFDILKNRRSGNNYITIYLLDTIDENNNVINDLKELNSNLTSGHLKFITFDTYQQGVWRTSIDLRYS